MPQQAIYVCPECEEVVRPQSDGSVTCQSCGHDLEKAPEKGSKPQTRLPGSKPHESLVSRNATRRPRSNQPSKPFGAADAIKAKLPELNPTSPGEAKRDSFKEEEIILEDGTKKVRRRKKRRKEKNKALYIILGLWLVIAAVVLFFVAGPKLQEEEEEVVATPEERAEVTRRTKHKLFLRKHQDDILKLVRSYLGRTSATGKIQLIDYSSELAAEFGRFYEFETDIQVEEKVAPVFIQVREFAEGKATPGIETIWQTSDGGIIEALAVYNGSEWVLDWEQMVRYSSESWPNFRLGIGRQEGTFRLLARIKAVTDKNHHLVVFHQPRRPGDGPELSPDRTASKDVHLAKDSALGRQFKEMWDNYSKGYRVYDSKFGVLDPNGWMRVTVRLAWEDTEDPRNPRAITIKGVEPAAWYGQRVQSIHREFPPEVILPDIDMIELESDSVQSAAERFFEQEAKFKEKK